MGSGDLFFPEIKITQCSNGWVCKSGYEHTKLAVKTNTFTFLSSNELPKLGDRGEREVQYRIDLSTNQLQWPPFYTGHPFTTAKPSRASLSCQNNLLTKGGKKTIEWQSRTYFFNPSSSGEDNTIFQVIAGKDKRFNDPSFAPSGSQLG